MLLPPTLEDVVADLRELRLHGLVELRRLALPALAASARAQGPSAVEALLQAALAGLGPGNLGRAAAYSLGLAQGTRDWPAQDRRRRAAEVYGVSVERFRKHQEQVLLEQFAEQVLQQAAAAAEPEAAQAAAVPPAPEPGLGPGSRVQLEHPLAGGAVVPVTVHLLPIELVRDVDVHVSSENVYFEVSRIFSATVSAGLRRATAVRDADGRIIDDVVPRELAQWLAEHSSRGGPVAPGTVAPTSAGSLQNQGVRRIYHAAVAAPVAGGNDYVVDESVVVTAVRNVFALARRERERFDPPLSALCFPLIGAGRGALSADTSIRVLWWALCEELSRDPAWRIHIATRRYDLGPAIVDHLIAQGARRAAGG